MIPTWYVNEAGRRDIAQARARLQMKRLINKLMRAL